ncbi:hypothetical protein [Roseateles sp. BYS87W]|uniref:YXWGXW repeat-containing protein n=1 Tax=Pelomonas baiyunensis TaxID=3299026 RepID=A0ABW7H2U9_9BURK
MKRLAMCVAVAACLSGCVVVPAHRHAGYGAPPGVIVDAPPPPAYVEPVPVMPYAGAVWVPGYWGWAGGRHQWVPGYYERPRPGYRYEPHRWENAGGRWHLRIGGWVRL